MGDFVSLKWGVNGRLNGLIAQGNHLSFDRGYPDSVWAKHKATEGKNKIPLL